MGRKLPIFAGLIVLTLALTAGFFGWFRPADDLLRSLRFASASRPASGQIVLVNIDSDSLQDVGLWPWPRRIHGDLINKLVDADAGDIVFDIDFSVPSPSKEDDAAFARALERAGGYVMLATFVQANQTDGKPIFNRPIDAFLAYSEPVAVNVPIAEDGAIRQYPYALTYQGQHFEGVASALSQRDGPDGQTFTIDYGIDVSTLPTISAKDVLDGKLAPGQLSGRKVIIGASAVELRDDFAVPRYGTLYGAAVQALAAETLLQGRALFNPGPLFGAISSVLLAGLFALLCWRAPFALAVGATLAMAAGVEVAALAAQALFAIALDTAVIHASLLGLVLLALAEQLGLRDVLLRKVSRAHAQTRSVLDRVISDNFDGVLVIGMDKRVVAASRLAEEMLGRQPQQNLVGLPITQILPETLIAHIGDALMADGGDRSLRKPVETELVSGEEVRIIEYVVTISDGADPDDDGDVAERVACLTFRDVTERRRSEERLAYLANHDPLTGALSRTRLAEAIQSRMDDDRLRSEGITVMLMDLSRFKAVNDSFGHSYGDEVLKQVVTRLRACSADYVARLGGDSFALVRTGVFSSSEMDRYCRIVLDRISEAYELGAHRAMIGAKLGVTDSRVSGYDPELLFSRADMALSAAHDIPGNAYAHYSPEMDEVLRDKQEMEVALRTALKDDQLSVAYQLQVSLATGEITGVEALVRWTHPQLGAVSPGVFIPVAEETGLIIELGRWVLNTACKEVATWPGKLNLAVNVSPLQFEFGDVVADVANALETSGLPADQLKIEVTEGLLVSNASAIIEELQRLRAMDVTIALDDFGTGYSSLSYLGRLPVDIIKIDQSFIRGLPQNQESGAIVRAVMTLSESLGKTVVAEGIENADQAWMLRLAGCHIGQGYHYGRPLGAEEILRRLAEEGAEPRQHAG